MGQRKSFDESLQVLSQDECLFLLGSSELGRIGFNVGGKPEVLPVNYAMEGRIVVFRTGPGTKLDFAPGTTVAFEVDSWDPALGVGWSVVIKGRAEEVTRSAARTAEHIRRAAVHPVAPGNRHHWLAIMPSEMTGRRFHVRQPHRPRL